MRRKEKKTYIQSSSTDRSIDTFSASPFRQVLSPLKMKMAEKSNLLKGQTLDCTLVEDILYTADPHEHFKDKPYSYPIKDEEQSFINSIYCEQMSGYAILPSAQCSSLCNLICFFYFTIFGLVFLVLAYNVQDIKIRYDNTCANQTVCAINFQLKNNFQAPVYLYYELDLFHTNHKFFIDSIQLQQMLGNEISSEDQNSNCVNAKFNRDMFYGDQFTMNSGSGYLLDQSLPANPCGVAAKYIFNGCLYSNIQDTFTMSMQSKNLSVLLNQSQITFFVDSDYKFNSKGDFSFSQWLDVENTLVMNWFGIQTLPRMMKLWARIDQNLFIGNFQMIINNNYPTSIFGGTKSFILSTTSQFGSKNLAFGITLLLISFSYLMSFFFICIRYKRRGTTKKLRIQPNDEEEQTFNKRFDRSNSDFFSSTMIKTIHSKKE